MPRLRTVAPCLIALACSLASSQEPERYFTVGPVLSFKVLGSEDARRGYFMGVQEARAERRFTLWGNRAQMVREVYVIETMGGGFRQWPETHAYNYGVSLVGRYWTKIIGTRGYWEAGWGLDYINRLTYDVYNRLNSSPVLGFGFRLGEENRGGIIGLRWRHISNAGTAGNNEGENYAQLVIGMRF